VLLLRLFLTTLTAAAVARFLFALKAKKVERGRGLADARVSTLAEREGGATARVQRVEPTTAAGEHALTLVDLSADALDNVLTCLDPDDELAGRACVAQAAARARRAQRSRAQHHDARRRRRRQAARHRRPGAR
jgi:hypothetical protein